MGKKLIITEKPGVAQDIARALGKMKKKKEYWENEDYIVTWAVGHLVTLAEPEDYDKKLKMWRLALLPVVPDEFKLKAIEGAEERLEVIKKLINSKEVEVIINACDAGREGELIFRYIYEFLAGSKPVYRLWLSSMTQEAIKEAFSHLKPGDDYELLAQAAKCRSEGDWLVGINGTRVFTARYKTLLSVGRVQTPTLAILVEREREIEKFVPVPYWEIFAEFSSPSGSYRGKWEKKEDRVWEKEKAQSIVNKVKGQEGKVAEYKERKVKEPHPLLYDLTELQRDANKLFGYSAKRTLDSAQRLYERHKLITYPRTNSRYLSPDLISQVEKCWRMLAECDFAEWVKEEFPRGKALKDKRIFDKSKVSDHHAIIPTGEKIDWESLSENDRRIMNLIVKRFIASFYPEAVWVHRSIKTVVEDEKFVSKSKVLLEAGWRAIYGKEEGEEEDFLPAVEKGTTVKTEKAWMEEKETKAPPRYTEATLLSAMEGAGRFVEDEELQEILKEGGIGTPATRAAIIERLIQVGYVERSGKTLIPTPKGKELINLIENIPVPELSSPQLTGEWEKKLNQIEKGEFSRDTFMEEIRKFTVEMVEKVKSMEDRGEREKMSMPVGNCPLCGAPVYENRKSFSCSRWKEGCPFTIWKKIAGRFINRQEAQKLITTGRTDKLYGFKSRKGKKFSAYLVLQEEGKVEFEFSTREASSGVS
ncbi:MAG TPA: DNA topoisomerase 3 [Candidatus Atribacteria bacterium]|nr:DNA topoisomerase 3 [Candidatus Atribacteria bacterium]HPT62896.1 DNA topoisomerase 3 [Candidatus Atribacteria bacterium]